MGFAADFRRLRAVRETGRRLTALVCAATAPLFLIAGCGSGDVDADPRADRVVFEAPVVVTEARVLDGDPTSGRCADGGACFKDNPDVLAGQRTLAEVHDLGFAFVSLPNGANPRNENRVVSLNTADSRVVSTGLAAPSDPNPTLQPLGLTAVAARWGTAAQSLVRLQLYGQSRTGGSFPNQYGVSVLSDGVNVGQFLTRLTNGNNNALLAAAGDFDGQGVDKIVYVAGDFIGAVAPVVEAGALKTLAMGAPLGIGRTSGLAVGNFLGSGTLAAAAVTGTALELQFFAVGADHRMTYLTDRTVKVTLRPGHSVVAGSARLVAGHFVDTAYHQLLLAFDEADADGKPVGVTFVLVGRDGNGAPLVLGTTSGALSGNASRLRLAAGRFLFTDAYEGVAVMQDFGVAGNGAVLVSLVGFGGETGTVPSVRGSKRYASNTCAYGLQTGNFDRQTVLDDGSRYANRHLQLALALGLDCNNGISGRFAAAVLALTPKSGEPLGLDVRDSGSDAMVHEIPRQQGGISIDDPVLHIAMAAVDLQGRSMVLGPPSTYTVESISQPSVVVAAPPMHVDWVDGRLVNYTAAPDGFFSEYTSDESSETGGSSTSTSSWSFMAKESLDAKFTYGDCKVACGSVREQLSAKQDLSWKTKALDRRLSGQSLDVRQRTRFDDVLWYTDQAVTFYVYPVVGKTTCPPAKLQGCSDAERVPLTLVVAGPDTVVRSQADASALPWYQPPWAPGNLLSYPATVNQLAAASLSDPLRMRVMSAPLRWAVDATESREKATWKLSDEKQQTVSSSGDFSFNSTTTVAAKEDFEVFKGEVSASVSLGGSYGFGNTTQSSTKVSTHTSLSFAKQAEFEETTQSGYWLLPYVFAQTVGQAAAVADPVNPEPLPDSFGALQSGFVVDLGGDRPLWSGPTYRQAPDLALLHPARLVVSSRDAAPAEQGDRSCIRVTADNYNCVGMAERLVERPLEDEYHAMRGFFISEADAPGQGPQLAATTAGTKLVLQARVHNLSLAAMPAGSKVRVRFHYVRWNSATGEPAGPSVTIGTASADPVPPHQSGDDRPNWVRVNQSFDTTGLDGQDLHFWVVAWIDADGSGARLLPEREDRGLTAIPPEGADFADVAALEQRHGNNVGFYPMPFHVRAAGAPTAQAHPRQATRPTLAITQAGSDTRRLAPGRSAIVAAKVRVGEHDLPHGARIVFYDGPPGAGARIVGERRQPHMRADATYDVRVRFRPAVCGKHTVHVVTAPGTRFEHVVRLAPIEMACRS